jgi:hypothetical protein
MARNVQLTRLVSDLRSESGLSSKVSVGVDQEDALKQTLRRVQEFLYDDFDWPHMFIRPTKTLSAGSRYYDFPSNLNMERVGSIVVWDAGTPRPLDRGIEWADYAQYNSDSGDRGDPVQKWDVRHTGSAEQIEVWPIPSSTTAFLQFEGIKTLGALTSGTDTADLDDKLIVLFAAAEVLARKKSEDASAKLDLARQRYSRLKGLSRGNRPTVAIGQGAPSLYRSGRTVIQVS